MFSECLSSSSMSSRLQVELLKGQEVIVSVLIISSCVNLSCPHVHQQHLHGLQKPAYDYVLTPSLWICSHRAERSTEKGYSSKKLLFQKGMIIKN